MCLEMLRSDNEEVFLGRVRSRIHSYDRPAQRTTADR